MILKYILHKLFKMRFKKNENGFEKPQFQFKISLI